MRRLAFLAAAVAWAVALAVPGFALAHGGAEGQLIVPGDHVLPGESFEITGNGIEPGTDLALQLTNGGTSIDLGTATVGEDGTFSTSVLLPATFPLGYSELTAAAEPDIHLDTFVLVGERAEGPQTPSETGAFGLDGQTIGFILLAIGGVIFVAGGLRYMRR